MSSQPPSRARSEPSPSPARRRTGEAVLLALGATVFFAWLAVRPEFLGNLSDSAVYLTEADFLSPFRAAPHSIGAAMFGDFSFPPLFPLLLAVLGGGSDYPEVSYLAGALMMGAAVAAVYVWLRSVAVARFAALTLTVVFALLPATLLAAMGLQSEPLYVALVFAGLAGLNTDPARPGAQRLGAVLVGLSALARSAGISVIAALIAHALLGRRRCSALLIGIALSPLLAWQACKYLLGLDASYLGGVPHDSAAAMLAFVAEQLGRNPAAMWRGLVSVFDLSATRHAQIAVMAFTIVAAIGWAQRLRRLELDALYLLAYLGIVTLWPYPDHMPRFLQVVMPIYLFYMYLGAVTVARGMRRRRLRQVPAAAIVTAAILVMAPSAAAIIGQVHAARGSDAENFVRTPQWYMYNSPLRAAREMDLLRQLVDAMRGIDEHVPQGACVSSAVYAYIPLYGRRRAVSIPGRRASDADFDAALKRCPYVFMMAGSLWPPSDFPPMYPHARVKQRLEIIEVSLWDRAARRGRVLTLLGRVRSDD